MFSLTFYFSGSKGGQGTVVGLVARIGLPDHDVLDRAIIVRWAPRERLVRELDRCRTAHQTLAAPLPACVLVDDEPCAVTTFPFDRRLPRLSVWLHPRSLVRVLESVDETGRDGWRVRKSRSSWRALSYRPERRAVIGWDVAEKNDESGERRSRRFVLRYAASVPSTPHDLLDRVRHAGVLAPRLVARADARVTIESFVEGTAGSLRSPWSPDVLESVGQSIARWHREGTFDDLPVSTPERLVRRARAAVRTVAAFDPALARRLADRCDALAATRPLSCSTRALHGDLHPGQFVVEGERVALLDWDRASAGDPAEDVANLFVHLRAAGAPADTLRAFRCGYTRVAPWPDDARLLWHEEAVRLRVSDLAIRRPAAVPADWTDRLFGVESSEERR